MKARSAHSVELDPYRAGVAIADALKDLEPEAILLFTTIHYGDAAEVLEAIFDVLDNPDLVLAGCTGDGFFETSRTGDVGVSAIAFHSGGTVRFRVASVRDAPVDSGAATRSCLARLDEAFAPEHPDLVFFVSDFHADGTAIENALHEKIRVPIVGGFAGDENFTMEKCFTFANRESLSDGIVALGMAGDFRFDIRLAHELRPAGDSGVVTGAERTLLGSVDGIGANDFVERALGRPVSRVDSGIVTLNVLDRSTPEKTYLRSIVPDSKLTDGSFSLFGSIPEGARVQVCLARPDDIIAEVYRVADEVKQSKFDPAAAVVISCAGRKGLLGNQISHEASAIVDAHGGELPLAGFPSFGEIGPVRLGDEYSETLFHNMTFVLLLLG